MATINRVRALLIGFEEFVWRAGSIRRIYQNIPITVWARVTSYATTCQPDRKAAIRHIGCYRAVDGYYAYSAGQILPLLLLISWVFGGALGVFWHG